MESSTLAQKVEKLRGLGTRTFNLDFQGFDVECRTLSTEEEAMIHTELLASGYDSYAYWYAYKIFKVAKSIVKLNGAVWQEAFNPEVFKADPETTAELFMRGILWSWDEELFRLFYKVFNAQLKLMAGKMISENGIEKFLDSTEIGYYKSIEMLERVETEAERKKRDDLDKLKEEKDTEILE